MKAIDLRAARSPGVLRPRDVVRRVAPGGDSDAVSRIAERALEARDAAARAAPWLTRPSCNEVERAVCDGRGHADAIAQRRRLQRAGRARSRAGTCGASRISTSPPPTSAGDARLVEHDLGDAEQDRHHGDADAEAGREHGAADRVRGERAERQPADHRVVSLLDAAVAHRQHARRALGERRDRA